MLHHNFHFICGAMDEDTPRLAALLSNPADNAPASNTDTANALKAEDGVQQPDHIISTTPATTSASSSKPQRRRNKPSLSCETCTVSRNYHCFRSFSFNFFFSQEEEIKERIENKNLRPRVDSDTERLQIKKTKVKRRTIPPPSYSSLCSRLF